MKSRLARLILVGILAATGLTTAVLTTTAGASSPHVTTLTLQSNQSYKPIAPPGATDDYHCTLVNPHVKSRTRSSSRASSSRTAPRSTTPSSSWSRRRWPPAPPWRPTTVARAGPASARRRCRAPDGADLQHALAHAWAPVTAMTSPAGTGSRSPPVASWSCRSTTTCCAATRRSAKLSCNRCRRRLRWPLTST